MLKVENNIEIESSKMIEEKDKKYNVKAIATDTYNLKNSNNDDIKQHDDINKVASIAGLCVLSSLAFLLYRNSKKAKVS